MTAEKRCPLCGAVWEELDGGKQMGCGECYAAFAGEMQMVIRKMYGGAVHRGALPGGRNESAVVLSEQQRLRRAWQSAVNRQDHVEAMLLWEELCRREDGYEQK